MSPVSEAGRERIKEKEGGSHPELPGKGKEEKGRKGKGREEKGKGGKGRRGKGGRKKILADGEEDEIAT